MAAAGLGLAVGAERAPPMKAGGRCADGPSSSLSVSSSPLLLSSSVVLSYSPLLLSSAAAPFAFAAAGCIVNKGFCKRHFRFEFTDRGSCRREPKPTMPSVFLPWYVTG